MRFIASLTAPAVSSSSENAVARDTSPPDNAAMTQPSQQARQLRLHAAVQLRWLFVALLVLVTLPAQCTAAFIRFSNCLDQSIISSTNPKQLQFVPLFVDAKFNTVDPRHNLNITIYGNVTGQRRTETGQYPPPTDPIWANNTDPFGKIVNSTVNYTTLFTDYQVVSYTPYNAPSAEFCSAVQGNGCPLGPLFGKNASDPSQLHRFSVGHDFTSSFSFATFDTTIRVQSGDPGGAYLACIKVGITPDLGSSISAAVRWCAIVVLGLVGIATVLTLKLHPSSSKNFFYWTSNYGRDEDMIRLVTPGFGDCLQYIQFAVLSGSLTLNYPGFFQPVLSKIAWSTLTFNESFVSGGSGYRSLRDGIYATNGTYGFSDLAELVGMNEDEDIWAGMAVWLLVIIAIVVIGSQLGFLLNWFRRRRNNSMPEDLQNKNLYWTGGNVTRIIFNFFLLPVFSLSIFQLVIAGHSPGWETALAAILLVAIVAFAAWTIFLIFTTNPRVKLFDHLPTLLLYGPLYNTYTDEAAPFAVIPLIVNLMRGIAIGAVQPSGIAQIIILAICEIVFILTLHAFRPFQKTTSMNAYHFVFSFVRLSIVLLCIAFVPFLDVDEGSKGWVGYIILFLHVLVLVFGFFLNAVQTLVEIFARMAGVKDTRGGVLRVFGVRQLAKRKEGRRHDSMGSSANMLNEGYKSPNSHRLTSMSGLSYGHHSSVGDRMSQHLDNFSQGAGTSIRSGHSPGPSTPGGMPQQFSLLPGGAEAAVGPPGRSASNAGLGAPYYRAPRQRAPTLETTDELGNVEIQEIDPNRIDSVQQLSPTAAQRQSLLSPTAPREEAAMRERRNQSDYYTSREGDFMYGVHRGRALSGSAPTRRRITGPADPMSPVSNATGWFKGMFNRRKKDKSKGFEVVRSTPLHLLREQDENSGPRQAPYTDTASGVSPPTQNSDSEWEIVQGKRAAGNGQDDRKPPLSRVASSNAPALRPLSIGESIGFAASQIGNDDMEADTSYQPPSRNPSRSAPIGIASQQAPPPSSGDRPVSPVQEQQARRRSAGNSVASSIYPPSINEDITVSHPLPLNRGSVPQHVAGEGYRRFSFQSSYMGSAAELVDVSLNPQQASPPATGTATHPPAPPIPPRGDHSPRGNFI